MELKPSMKIFLSPMPQAAVKHQVLLLNRTTLDIDPSCQTQEYLTERPSYTTAKSLDLSAALTDTVWAPLGAIVHAHREDRADSADVGHFIPHADEFFWLKSFLQGKSLYSGSLIDNFILMLRQWLTWKPERK
jgi:hypothetical protein